MSKAKPPKLQQLQLQVEAINNILYPCLYADKGCKKMFKSKLLDDHVNYCGFRPKRCPLCEREVMIKDLIPDAGSFMCSICAQVREDSKNPFKTKRDELLFAKIVQEEFQKEFEQMREQINKLQSELAMMRSRVPEDQPKKQKRKRYGVTRLARALNEWLQKKYLIDKVSCEQAANTFQLATKLEIPKKLMSHVFLLALNGLNSRKKSKFKIPFSPYKLQNGLIVMRSEDDLAQLAQEEEEQEEDLIIIVYLIQFNTS